MSKSAKVMLGLLAGVAVVGAAVFVLPQLSKPHAPQSVVEAAAPSPAAPLVAENTPESAAEPEAALEAEPEEAEAAPQAPVIEVVRADAEGMVVVAGAAEPGASVEIRLNDEAVEEVVAGPDGTFAAFLALEDTGRQNVVSLAAEGQVGDEAIIAAIEAPKAPAASTEPAAYDALAEAASTTPDLGGVLASNGGNEAPAQPQVLISSAEGVSLAQPAALPSEASEGALLETISYNASGDLLFSGRSQGAGKVNIYIDNAMVGSAEAEANGQWRLSHQGVNAGRHLLRVDHVDGAGKVIARVETPFQREAMEQLAIAMVEQGTGGISQRVVQPGHTLWALARDQYGQGIRYVEVFEANKDRIRNPDLIYPGQVFTLPELAAE